ncbi:MAG: class I SAM-dependent RNA methyltransferase [Desulfobacteraceae bacterium]|nr:class I SAM-dependent RNA methyltransferase [Desulfobacteraceae bacterium]MBC2754171.1 class I SAM-dependent RNA methyltransferase [Desulfobacteraceae bacterium]
MTDNVEENISLKSGCNTECPGCAHKHLTRAQSLAQKEKWLKNRLAIWTTKFDPIRTVDEKSRWGYRGKVCLSTQWENGKWHFGLIKNETVIPIHDCPVHTRQIQEAISLLSASLPPAVIFPLAYYVQTGSQITLVVKSKQMPDLTWLDDPLIRALNHFGIKGLWVHLHPCTGKKVFAKNTWHLLYGSPRSVDENQFIYGPRSFQQLIPALYDQALSSAETFLTPAAEDIFIDLYCGIGAGLARWQQRCATIMGVELDGEAVDCARENAPNVTILRGKCSDRIPQLIQWADSHPPYKKRRLYVNPPRTGLEPKTLQWIAADYKPDRMVYLSCSAGTLQRDLAHFEINGYQIIKITPYDFFPQTLHVETMVFIQPKNKI